MATVFSYIRFSSKPQELGDSFRRQTRLRNSWLQRHPEHELDDSIRLRDLGTSAFRGKNLDKDKGDLGKFIELAKQGRIERGSILLLEKLDRFSRQPPSKAYRVFCELVETGITVQTLEPEQTIDENNIDNMEVIIPTIVYLQIAHEQSKDKSNRVGHAWKSKREQAREDNTPMNRRCPSWLKWDEDKGKFVKTQHGERVIRYIFRQTANGVGQRKLLEELTKKYKPLIETTNPKKPRHWNASFIKKVLADRAVLGELQPYKKVDGERVPDGAPLPDYYPRIIDDELFYQVQAERKARTKRKGPTGDFVNVLRGLIYMPDGYKGHLYQTRANLKGGGVYLQRRIVSYAKLKRLPDAFPITIDYHKLEDIVLAVLNDITPDDLQPPNPTNNPNHLANLKLALEGVDNRLAELHEALEHGRAVVEITNAIENLKEKRTTITKQIDDLNTQSSKGFVEPLKDAQSVIDYLRNKPKREHHKLRLKLQNILGHVVERIDVSPKKDGRKSIFSTAIQLKNGTIIRIQPNTNPEHIRKWFDGMAKSEPTRIDIRAAEESFAVAVVPREEGDDEPFRIVRH